MVALWIALGAMVRQRDELARNQALAFELERSELARQALDTRMHLLQAQVQPHFLFNTLANVQALVETGSPQASKVLESLIAYFRAAVPRLHDPATTLGQELQLARAYLELMHMRMPDRLQFSLQADAEALELRCPPMTLLTLVENAVGTALIRASRAVASKSACACTRIAAMCASPTPASDCSERVTDSAPACPHCVNACNWLLVAMPI